MRVTTEQIQQIHVVLSHFLKTVPYRLYLYGSRVHDHLKGGDFDLLVLLNDDGLKIFRNQELDILVEIKKKPDIGQRKIDIKAVTEEDLLSKPFFKLVAQEMIELKADN